MLRRIAPAVGIATFLIGWQVMSMILSDIIVASPADTVAAFIKLAATTDFWRAVAVTGIRFVVGCGSGIVVGALLGVLGGFVPFWARAFEPIRWILMSVPPVVLVTMGMILFGMGSGQTIVVTSVLILPIMYVNTLEGIRSVDHALVEMAQSYRANRSVRIREIYLPGIGSHVVAGLTLSAGLGVRIVVLAELLGAYSGIGHEFSLARTNLQTDNLYAWILACLFIIAVLEFGVFLPIRRRMNRWKPETGAAGHG